MLPQAQRHRHSTNTRVKDAIFFIFTCGQAADNFKAGRKIMEGVAINTIAFSTDGALGTCFFFTTGAAVGIGTIVDEALISAWHTNIAFLIFSAVA